MFMSRGWSRLQLVLLKCVADADKPVTYAEIISGALQSVGGNDPTLPPDRERSLRRALKNLCDRKVLFTRGSGRPGDPYRYTFERTCGCCHQEIPAGKGLMSRNGMAICFQCAGMIAQAYAEIVLPELLKQRQAKAPETMSHAYSERHRVAGLG
jgi:hypothetical protein